jgi:uncharacterized protein (TIGR00297 family)
MPMDYIIWGTIGATLIAYLGYRFHALTKSGAISAALIGTIIFGLGGYVAAAAIIYFFLTGSLLSLLPPAEGMSREKIARNWKQVVCNGAPAALAVMLVYFVPSYRESGTLFFFGAFSTATADTWATELGMRGSKRAYHILSFRPVAKGMSGGVSFAGVLASIVGALSFAVIPFALLPGDDLLCGLFLVAIIPIVAVAGIIGSILDSVIGATLQAKYQRPDGSLTELRETNSRRISGMPFVTNDVTNLLATSWGGLIAVGLTTLF